MPGMKVIKFAWIPVLFLSACSWVSDRTIQPQSLLTPYVTSTVPAQTVEVTPTVEVSTPEPTPSPTPFVHTLASGETISSLAANYGITTNEILAINPQITPKALSVGTEIIIPYIGTGDSEGEETALSVISEPLALEVSNPECTQTAEGGLWCVVLVRNPLDQNAVGISVKFTLKNEADETLKEETVPALLNLLETGQSLPVMAYFAPDLPAEPVVETELKTALPLDSAGADYQPLELKVNSIDLNGRSAQISAVISANSAESVWIGLVAYDQDGRVVGVRRLEYTGGGEDEAGQAIKVYVYSNAEDIRKVDVMAETITQKQ